MNTFNKVIIVLLGTLFCSYANATVMSYDFSSISTDGQNYEGLSIGDMTFSSELGGMYYTSSYGGGIRSSDAGAATDIYIDFSTAIDSFTARGGDGAGDLDAFGILAYEFGTGTFLGSVYTPQFGGANEPEWYSQTISFANIGRIVLDPCSSGICPGSAAAQGGLVFTDVSFNTAASVPEPSSLALLGLGLLGLGYLQRKRFTR